MKLSLSILASLAICSSASAQIYASDTFCYGGALTANGWTAHSGAGNKVIEANGSFAKLNFSGGSGEDVNLGFPALTATDDVFAAFTLNVPSGNPVNPDSSGSYCVHFKDSSFGFRGRFGLLSPAAAGDFQVAINASGSSLGSGGVWPVDLTFDTNYLIVISYDAGTGESKLWVDPVGSASSSVSHVGTAGTLIESIALRQSNDHTGFIHVSDMRVGNTFWDVETWTSGESLTSIPGFISNNGGAAGGAVYFTLDVTNANGISLCNMALNSGTAAGTPISGALYLNAVATDVTLLATGAPALAASNWGALAAMSGVSAGTDNQTEMTFSNAVNLPVGQYMFAVTGDWANRYTNGDLTNNTAVGTGLTFIGGKASNSPFTGTVFSSSTTTPFRLLNARFDYELPAAPVTQSPVQTLSKVETVGIGCDGAGGSWYEVQAGGGDLNGVTVTGTPNGSGGIDVTTGPGSVAAPSPAAVVVAIGDDAQVDTATIGGTLGIWIGSNGIVSTGPGNTTGFSPSVATMLGDPSPGFYTWHDLQPDAAGSGQIYYEESGSVATVIFDGVFEWGTTTPFFAQFVIDTANGGYAVTVGSTTGQDYLCAYGTAGASIDTGGVDVSAGGFSHTPADVPNLSLSSTSPIIGADWTLTTDNIQAGAFSLFFFGDTNLDPAVDLTGLGAPGCFAHTNANLGLIIGSAVAGGSSSTTLTLPAVPALAGGQLVVQSTATSNNLAIGFATSNGVIATLGDL